MSKLTLLLMILLVGSATSQYYSNEYDSNDYYGSYSSNYDSSDDYYGSYSDNDDYYSTSYRSRGDFNSDYDYNNYMDYQ